jgi:hypothetical protein
MMMPYKGKEAMERKSIFCSELVAYGWSCFGAVRKGIKIYRILPKHYMGGTWRYILNRSWALGKPFALVV